MYMNEKDIKALKVLVQNVEGVARTTSRNARAINQLAKLLQQNEKRIQQQRKSIKRMTAAPRTTKKNDIWD